MFEEPIPGDIWIQLAVILKKLGDQYEIALSDKDGRLKTDRLMTISKESFHKQYFPNPFDPGHHVKKVKILDIITGTNVKLVILDSENNETSNITLLITNFKKTFFLDVNLSEPFSQIKKETPPEEDQIIELDDEAT